MLYLTKIFHFEMAHALDGYPGPCKDIHGHSYELHVTVSGEEIKEGYFSPPGFIADFKELKQAVRDSVIKKLDHKLVLSGNYRSRHPGIAALENLLILEAEPSAENLLIYIQTLLTPGLPATVRLVELRLYETKDSYATLIIPDRQ